MVQTCANSARKVAHEELKGFNINKMSYRICVWDDIVTELHRFFYCKFHDTARAVLFNKFCHILTDNKLPEHFDCLSNVELLLLFLFGLSDVPTQISVDVFCAVVEFLKLNLVIDSDCILVTLCVIYVWFVLSYCIFVHISSLWHDKIAVIRLTPVAKLSLKNKSEYMVSKNFTFYLEGRGHSSYVP